MSDLVKRLRDMCGSGAIRPEHLLVVTEAAAEIERLEAKITLLEQWPDYHAAVGSEREQCAKIAECAYSATSNLRTDIAAAIRARGQS